MGFSIFDFRFAIGAALLSVALVGAGCQAPMRTPYGELYAGSYGAARVQVRENLVAKRSDRRYLLDRMRLGVLTLADGYPRAAQTVFEEVYDVLRTQGINRDKTVASVVLNEDLKIWKGEPFEQALALTYYSMVQAELGSWDNARAAADNALFHLRDFGEDEDGDRLNTYEIARRSLIYERAVDAGDSPAEALRKSQYLTHGYVARESNFTLGYLLHGIADQQLGRTEEAADYFTRVMELEPDLEPMVEALAEGTYNTVLVVSWGLGPEKVGYGPDNALARFAPRYPSTGTPLYVRVGDYEGRRYPQVLDVNTMAGDHMWNNLEDVRAAKSTLGTALLYGGVAATAIGADVDSDEAVYAGLGAAAAGLFLKAGAHVDVRYADVFPQRFYVIPLRITEPGTTVTLQVDGQAGSRLVLTGLTPPDTDQAQLRYVRLPSPRGMRTRPPAWATSGTIYYGNPVTGPVEAAPLPYILGGRDARPPTERVLNDYQRAGHLRSLTLAELRELYAAEGIAWTLEDQEGYVGAHVLEGGRSLVAPLGGTTGFVRLFGQPHPSYRPRSGVVAEIIEEAEAPPTLPSPALDAVIGRPQPRSMEGS